MRCSWCMREIKEGKPVFGLNVTFSEGIDYSEKEGYIIQIKLSSRNTSVPMIVVPKGSKAKREGVDGTFPICSQKCGQKMREALSKELETFKVLD